MYLSSELYYNHMVLSKVHLVVSMGEEIDSIGPGDRTHRMRGKPIISKMLTVPTRTTTITTGGGGGGVGDVGVGFYRSPNRLCHVYAISHVVSISSELT